MKKLKALLFLSFLMGMVKTVQAVDEAASVINFAQTQIGVSFTSTGPTRTGEIRNTSMNDLGERLMLDGKTDLVIASTGGPVGILGGGRADFLIGGSSWVYTVGNTTNAFTVPASSIASVMGCRNFGDNCNLVKLASVASPVFVKRLSIGDVVGNGSLTPGRTRIRIFDTQGTTGTNNTPLNLVYNQTVTSGTIQDIGVWCSSGVMVLKDSPADFQLYLGKQTR